MRIGYFTGGGTGAGHLIRGMAIERGLRRQGVQAEYRMFSCVPALPGFEGAAVSFLPMTREEVCNPARARESEIARALRDYSPDVLLVDLFWGAVRHILPLPGCEAWLLLRWCPSNWLDDQPGMTFDRSQFARIIGFEPHSPCKVGDLIEPIVVCNPSECRPKEDLKRHLGIALDEQLTLVVQTGRPGEIDQVLKHLDQNAPGVAVIATMHRASALFPLAPWLGGADRILGGVGYNLFWETLWLGLQDRSQLLAFPRKIDDQAARVVRCANYRMRENGADMLARQLGAL